MAEANKFSAKCTDDVENTGVCWPVWSNGVPLKHQEAREVQAVQCTEPHDNTENSLTEKYSTVVTKTVEKMINNLINPLRILFMDYIL